MSEKAAELFQVSAGTAPAAPASRSSHEPEVCPLCGEMAEYVERFGNGRFMSSHKSVDRVITGKVTGRELVVKGAVLCEGFVRVKGLEA